MAVTISFPSNGSEASGYLVKPEGGTGPGVLVIQEWWGLDSGIKEMATRLAAAGFVALAPDLYHGELAQHDEMDKANQWRQAMPPDRAARDMSGAIDHLASLEGVTGKGIGVVGFCMGGGVALLTAGSGFEVAAVNYGQLPRDLDTVLAGACPVVASYGGRDRSLPRAAARLEQALTNAGVAGVSYRQDGHVGVAMRCLNTHRAGDRHDVPPIC